MPRAAVETVRAPWGGIVLVCRKCSKKLDGGFGPDGTQALGKALKAELKATGRRRALRIVPVGCLGLCPKRAVTVVGPNDPGAVLVVPAGAQTPDILDAIGLPPSQGSRAFTETDAGKLA